MIGIYENFGQIEVRNLKDKYGYTPEVEEFENWCMTYTGRQKTKVAVAVCDECGDRIYSRSSHDLIECSCGKTFINGGRDYVHTNAVKTEVVEIPYSEHELVLDYMFRYNKLGRLKSKV